MHDNKSGNLGTQSFEIGKALSVPFRLPGGRDFLIRLILWAAAALMLVYAFFGAGLFSSLAEVMAITSSAEIVDPLNDPALVSAAVSFYGSLAVVGFFAWLVMACVETAVHKNIFHGTDGGLLPIRLGVAEFHVIVTQFVVFLCVMAAYFIGSIVTGILMAIGGMSALFLSMIVLLFIMGSVGIRFAPSAAIAVREGTLHIGSGLRASQPYFWKMLLCYLIVGMVGFIATYITLVIGISFVISAADLETATSGAANDGAALLSALGESLGEDKPMLPLIAAVIAYAVVNVVSKLFIWGIGNYAAQLDGQAIKT